MIRWKWKLVVLLVMVVAVVSTYAWWTAPTRKTTRLIEYLYTHMGEFDCFGPDRIAQDFLLDRSTNSADRELKAMGSRAVPPLIDLLKDKRSGIRQLAAQYLGQMKDRRAVPALIVTMNDQEVDVRNEAVRSLGAIGDPLAVKPLIAALSNQTSGCCCSAARALGHLGDRIATPALLKALQDTNFMLRESAADGLGDLRDPRAIDALVDSLDNTEVSWNAALALAKMHRADGISELLTSVKDSGSYGAQLETVKALGELGDPRAKPALQEVAASNRSPEMNSEVAKALAKLATTEPSSR